MLVVGYEHHWPAKCRLPLALGRWVQFAIRAKNGEAIRSYAQGIVYDALAQLLHQRRGLFWLYGGCLVGVRKGWRERESYSQQ